MNMVYVFKCSMSTNNRVCTIRTSDEVLVLVLGAELEPYSTHSCSISSSVLDLISLYLETEPGLEVVLKTTQFW